ncbi:MAG: hypothetical protein AAF226_19315 [Verrucomicrobiota bacterium]
MNTSCLQRSLLLVLFSSITSLTSYSAPGSGLSKQEHYEKIHPVIRQVESNWSQSGALKSLVPDKMASGQNGYLIATNEEFRQNSEKLEAFIPGHL